jgi:hypothetical protein
MAKRKGKEKTSKQKHGRKTIIFTFMEYHEGAFAELHFELERDGETFDSFHPIRQKFWGGIDEGIYDSEQGKELVNKYLEVINTELSNIIRQHCLGYWLHILRRIACVLSPVKEDTDPLRPEVAGLVRCMFEAIIQKYGTILPCEKINVSNQVDLDEILNGYFTRHNLEKVGNQIIENPQLVLTSFTKKELLEFYRCEQLAFELWRCSANLRGLGKGSLWGVSHNPVEAGEVRDKVLTDSLMIYDERSSSFDPFLQVTAKGTIYEFGNRDESQFGGIFVPVYNVGRIDTKDMIKKLFEFHFEEIITNFIWIPINIKNYYHENIPYSEEFRRKNGVDIQSVISIFTAISIRASTYWIENPELGVRYWRRAYEGPFRTEYILDEINEFIPHACEILQLNPNDIDVLKGFDFWRFTDEKRSFIDLTYPGPHSIFLPYGDNRYFIDYAWMLRRLFDLFWNCKIRNENFKGEAFELFVQKQINPILPTTPLKSHDGEKKQIDASIANEKDLLIIECKAIGRAIAFDRGIPEAIQYRKDCYDQAIDEVDEKAKWLIEKQHGTNFNVMQYDRIIPIVITPFTEYIRTDERKYWLSDRIPRVLKLQEIIQLIENGAIWSCIENVLSTH